MGEGERQIELSAAWQLCVAEGGSPGLVEIEDEIFVSCAAIGVFWAWPLVPVVLEDLLFPGGWVTIPPG